MAATDDGTEVPADVEALGEALEGFAIDHRLRSLRGFDGHWIVTVEEPGLFEDHADHSRLKINYEELDL